MIAKKSPPRRTTAVERAINNLQIVGEQDLLSLLWGGKERSAPFFHCGSRGYHSGPLSALLSIGVLRNPMPECGRNGSHGSARSGHAVMHDGK